MRFDRLRDRINKGDLSIVATIHFDEARPNKVTATPIVMLRVKAVNRPTIDLFWYKSACSQLTDTGCAYTLEQRPACAAAMQPSEESPGDTCYALLNTGEFLDPACIIQEWLPYQRVMKDLVRHFSSKPFSKLISEQLRILQADINARMVLRNYQQLTEDERHIADMFPLLKSTSFVF